MKKIVFLVGLFSILSLTESKAQWRLNAGVDLVKTPFFAENTPAIQLGLEASYFFARSFAFTGGLEIWEEPVDQFGVSLGLRAYPLDPIFLRMRGILASESDFNIGVGYIYPLSKQWALEIISDYYTTHQDFALRVGVGVSL